MFEIMSKAFDWHIHDVYTAIPCRIVNVKDINEQRVDVQPLVNLIDPNGVDTPHQTLLSVPLIFPATNTSALTFEVNTGDTVLCIFSHRCIDMVKAGNGTPARPLDLRKLDKRDACALIGMFPFAKAINNPAKRTWAHNTSDTVLAHNIGTSNEVEIRLRKDGSFIINTTKDVEVNCASSKVTATNSATITAPTTTVNGDLAVNGNIQCSQTVTASTDVVGGGKSLKNHVHAGVQSGGSSTAPPT